MYERARYGAAGCALICFVGFAAIPYMISGSGDPHNEAPDPDPVPPLPSRAKSPRLTRPPVPTRRRPPSAELSKLWHARKYDDALRLATEFLADKNRPDAVKAAKRKLPNCLQSVFQERLRTESYEDARNLLSEAARLKALAIESGDADWKKQMESACERINKEWARVQPRRAQAAIKSGDVDRAERVCRDIWEDPLGKLPRDDYCNFKVGRWKTARAAGRKEEAEKHLRAAAEVAASETHFTYSKCRQTPVEKALGEAMSLEELCAEGERYLKTGDHVMAICYLMAAKEKYIYGDREVKWKINKQGKKIPVTIVRGGPDKAVLLKREPKVYAAILGLAKDAQAGKLRWLPPDRGQSNKVEILLGAVIRFSDKLKRIEPGDGRPAEKYSLSLDAWHTKWAMLLDKAEAMMEMEDYSDAVRLCDRMLELEPQYYLNFRKNVLEEDPWSAVPAKLKTEIEKQHKDSRRRYAELIDRIRKQIYTPPFPGREKVLELQLRALARQGIELFARNPASALQIFRTVMRRAPAGREAAGIRDTLLKAIRGARDRKDFNALYVLAGFFLGELTPESLEKEVREELALGLRSAADHFKTKSPMKRIFMLSLIADVLVDTPKGKAAREEAMKLGIEAAAKMPTKEPRRPTLSLPSGLPGLSVVAVDNVTQYHIMIFHGGPERFYVRLNPYRRGVVVLKDGAYEVAVIVTSDHVRPYKGKYQFASKYYQDKWVIVQQGKGQGPVRRNPFEEARGDYFMLRSPPDAGRLRVINKEMGLVSKE